jgi:hypothetical protein
MLRQNASGDAEGYSKWMPPQTTRFQKAERDLMSKQIKQLGA